MTTSKANVAPLIEKRRFTIEVPVFEQQEVAPHPDGLRVSGYRMVQVGKQAVEVEVLVPWEAIAVSLGRRAAFSKKGKSVDGLIEVRVVKKKGKP